MHTKNRKSKWIFTKMIGMSLVVLFFFPLLQVHGETEPFPAHGEQARELSRRFSISKTNSAMIRANGTVLVLGDDSEGQCDVSGWQNIVEIALGEGFIVGLRSDGTVVAAGRNYVDDLLPRLGRAPEYGGQLDVEGWTDIVHISAGLNHTLGLKRDGTVVAVGLNDDGQCDVGEWANIVQIIAANCQSYGLGQDGTLVYAGVDFVHHYGGERGVSQIAVHFLNAYVLFENGNFVFWDYDLYEPEEFETRERLIQIDAGNTLFVGLAENGRIWYIDGEGTGTYAAPALQNIAAISVGGNAILALKDDGELALIRHYSPREQIRDWTDIVQIASGATHVLGLKKDGTVVAAGPGREYAYDLWEMERYKVSDWGDVVAVGVREGDGMGGDLSLGLTQDGELLIAPDYTAIFQREEDYFGEELTAEIIQALQGNVDWLRPLSDGTVSEESKTYFAENPRLRIDIQGIEEWADLVQLDCSERGSGYSHVVGLRADGSVLALGNNDYGQCDVGDWQNVTQLSVVKGRTVGLLRDGTVIVAGRNDMGQCRVDGWMDVVSIHAGIEFTAGIKADGTLWIAGFNDFGQYEIDGSNLYE